MINNVIASLLILVILSACQKSATPKYQTLEDGVRTNQPVSVETALVKGAPLGYTIESRGRLDAQQVSELYFERSGMISKVYKTNGEYVKRGELIAILDTTDLTMEKRKALLNAEKAKLEFENLLLARTNLGNDSASIINNLMVLSGYKEAKITLEEIEQKIAFSRLEAPFTGIITSLVIRPFSKVETGLTVGKLYNPKTMVYTTQLLESDFGKVSVGTFCDVQPISALTHSIQGRVSQINPEISKDGVWDVTVILDNSNFILGMHARGTFSFEVEDVIQVPKEAITIREGKKVVFTSINNKAQWNSVDTGIDNGEFVQITQGLTLGDTVIISNQIQLEHGRTIIITGKPK